MTGQVTMLNMDVEGGSTETGQFGTDPHLLPMLFNAMDICFFHATLQSSSSLELSLKQIQTLIKALLKRIDALSALPCLMDTLDRDGYCYT